MWIQRAAKLRTRHRAKNESEKAIVCLSFCPSAPSVRLSIRPSVHLSVCPSVRLSVCPSACSPVGFVRLSAPPVGFWCAFIGGSVDVWCWWVFGGVLVSLCWVFGGSLVGLWWGFGGSLVRQASGPLRLMSNELGR